MSSLFKIGESATHAFGCVTEGTKSRVTRLAQETAHDASFVVVIDVPVAASRFAASADGALVILCSK